MLALSMLDALLCRGLYAVDVVELLEVSECNQDGRCGRENFPDEVERKLSAESMRWVLRGRFEGREVLMGSGEVVDMFAVRSC